MRYRGINVGTRSTPEHRTRIIIDANGIEWEVYDDSAWSTDLVLDWDYLPQLENPGLIFNSRVDRRRVWPCPPNWRKMSDAQLLSLVFGARSLF